MASCRLISAFTLSLLLLDSSTACPFAGKDLGQLRKQGIIPPNDGVHRRLSTNSDSCHDHATSAHTSSIEVNLMRCSAFFRPSTPFPLIPAAPVPIAPPHRSRTPK